MLQATSALEDPGALKSEEQAANAAHILAQAALKYNQLENVTGRMSCCPLGCVLLACGGSPVQPEQAQHSIRLPQLRKCSLSGAVLEWRDMCRCSLLCLCIYLLAAAALLQPRWWTC